MARLNRGETTRLSIRLSAGAKEKIEVVRNNLNLSKSGMILFALSNIFKETPSKEVLINLESKIILETDHFPVTVKADLGQTIDRLCEQYDMKKNALTGFLVSDYFEKLQDENLLEIHEPEDPKKVMFQVNEDLKKKMIEYSEKTYIPLSGLVSLSILHGPYIGIPSYQNTEPEVFYTNIPFYLYRKMKSHADDMGLPEHFYVSQCVYKAFFSDEKIFD